MPDVREEYWAEAEIRGHSSSDDENWAHYAIRCKDAEEARSRRDHLLADPGGSYRNPRAIKRTITDEVL